MDAPPFSILSSFSMVQIKIPQLPPSSFGQRRRWNKKERTVGACTYLRVRQRKEKVDSSKAGDNEKMACAIDCNGRDLPGGSSARTAPVVNLLFTQFFNTHVYIYIYMVGIFFTFFLFPLGPLFFFILFRLLWALWALLLSHSTRLFLLYNAAAAIAAKSNSRVVCYRAILRPSHTTTTTCQPLKKVARTFYLARSNAYLDEGWNPSHSDRNNQAHHT